MTSTKAISGSHFSFKKKYWYLYNIMTVLTKNLAKTSQGQSTDI